MASRSRGQGCESCTKNVVPLNGGEEEPFRGGGARNRGAGRVFRKVPATSPELADLTCVRLC